MADWAWDLFRSFLGAGAGTAAVTGGVALWRDRGKKRAEATYLAMRLAVALEAYAADCADLIQHNENAPHFPEEEFARWDLKLPILAPYVDDAEGWKALNSDLAGRCLDFRNRISGSQGVVRDAVLHNVSRMGAALEDEACNRGIEAWRLALDLRKNYQLPEITPVFGYQHYLLRKDQEIELSGSRVMYRAPAISDQE